MPSSRDSRTRTRVKAYRERRCETATSFVGWKAESEALQGPERFFEGSDRLSCKILTTKRALERTLRGIVVQFQFSNYRRAARFRIRCPETKFSECELAALLRRRTNYALTVSMPTLPKTLIRSSTR
ncbi:hypothetical protein Tco_0277162 [Tanacetum coccineum]